MAQGEFKWIELSMKTWLVLLGQRTMSNSSLQDVSRVKYLQGNIGGVLDALRYEVLASFFSPRQPYHITNFLHHYKKFLIIDCESIEPYSYIGLLIFILRASYLFNE